jgi:hypothetical protein
MSLARHFALEIHDLLSSPPRLSDLSTWIESIGLGFYCRYAAQMVMGVVVVVSFKPSPSLVLNAHKTNLGSTTSQIAPRFHSQHEDYDSRQESLEERLDKILRAWGNCWSKIYPHADMRDRTEELRSCATHFMRLDEAFGVNSDKHEIRFCWPNTPFDPHWMQAEDKFGLLPHQLCVGKTVLMCLFPAILKHHDNMLTTTLSGPVRTSAAQDEQAHLSSRDISVVARAVVWLQ